MTKRIWNFSAGPAVLPESVLEEARDNLLSLGSTGIGILEHSHRGKAFLKVYEETEALCREIGGIPANYKVLFLQGGASSQFFMIPMNFLAQGSTADYLVTGSWSEKAKEEAERFGTVHVACSSGDKNYSYVPQSGSYSASPVYAHYTSNNTIFGTQFHTMPTPPANVPLVCDASSDIFSRPIDIAAHGIVYAGAQKNLGPSGVTLVIIRDDLVERGAKNLPVAVDSRSNMNVTFVTGNADLDTEFCSAATKAGFDGLKGHRSVGGMRASIYNAFPEEGVDALVDFLREFENKKSV